MRNKGNKQKSFSSNFLTQNEGLGLILMFIFFCILRLFIQVGFKRYLRPKCQPFNNRSCGSNRLLLVSRARNISKNRATGSSTGEKFPLACHWFCILFTVLMSQSSKWVCLQFSLEIPAAINLC